ncbi:DUF6246 family protein [Pseudomonas aeruginosa]|uniref:DUF6246 family protein n=1 Tax=Pseudomonas aeruginosa TaxID=287 RepID=UPI0015655A0C|nr:DUF6246 family protein [Pseudomonas aeruginosa]
MTQLGTPAEIVDVFARVMSDPVTEKHQADQFADALAVVVACCEQDCPTCLATTTRTWSTGQELRTSSTCASRALPAEARRHRSASATPRRHDEEPNYSGEFVAREYVATAIAHLGLSEREAWSMTMTA